jgi:hypothetical protein
MLLGYYGCVTNTGNNQWRTKGVQGAMAPLEQQPHTSKLTTGTTDRQKNRSNIPAENAQQYYKRSVLLPLVDSCLAQLSERFQGGSAIISKFSLLLPPYCCNATTSGNDSHTLQKMYYAFLPSEITVETELLRWKS